MKMMEYLAQGYVVVVESMFGEEVWYPEQLDDLYVDDEEEECEQLVKVDEEAHVAYFVDAQDYDD